MSTGPTNLYDLAAELLAAIVVGYGQQGIESPAVAYVNGAGATPLGICETLVVGWTRVNYGVAGGPNFDALPVRQQLRSRTADLSVWMFRCMTPIGSGQEAGQLNTADLEADAKRIMTDAYLLPKVIAAAHEAGSFGDYCSGLSIQACLPIEPLGGVSGTMVDLTAELS